MWFYCDSVVREQKKQMFYLVDSAWAQKKRIQFIDIGAHNEHQCMHIFKVNERYQDKNENKANHILCMWETTLFFHFTLNLNWMQCASDRIDIYFKSNGDRT